MAMLGYFLLSIIESLAISQLRAEHHQRIRRLSDELVEKRQRESDMDNNEKASPRRMSDAEDKG